jgi:succinyl-CoA synthetase alpha subunit
VRIHEFGGGVSQLIGTGGRDLSEKIGGLMMLDAIDMLEADDGTQVIALISKPPASRGGKSAGPRARLPQAGGCLLPRPQRTARR